MMMPANVRLVLGYADRNGFGYRFFAGRELRLADLPQRFADSHRRAERDVQAPASALHRDQKPGLGKIMDMIGNASRFATEQKDITVHEAEIRVGKGATSREKDQSPVFAAPPSVEGLEVNMPGERGHLQIVHARAPEVAIGEIEAGRLDDIDGDAEAGGHAEDRAGVAGNVGLIERDADAGSHCHVLLICGSCATAATERRKSSEADLAISGEWLYRAAIVNSNRRRQRWTS